MKDLLKQILEFNEDKNYVNQIKENNKIVGDELVFRNKVQDKIYIQTRTDKDFALWDKIIKSNPSDWEWVSEEQLQEYIDKRKSVSTKKVETQAESVETPKLEEETKNVEPAKETETPEAPKRGRKKTI